jgi:hypothetical protein
MVPQCHTTFNLDKGELTQKYEERLRSVKVPAASVCKSRSLPNTVFFVLNPGLSKRSKSTCSSLR